MNNEKEITFEWDQKKERLSIYLNDKGIDKLIEYLNFLKQSKEKFTDIQLMSPEWGGEDLTGDENDMEGKKINLVKLIRYITK